MDNQTTAIAQLIHADHSQLPEHSKPVTLYSAVGLV